MKARLLAGLRLAAAGAAPFLLAELALRVAGWQPPADPYFAGFSEAAPIFAAADGVLAVAPEHRRTWRAEAFPAQPEPGALRIFSVGDSVTWGHRGNEFPDALLSYSEALQGLLRRRVPGGPHRVVNCGARTFSTGRMAQVAAEVLGYAPDAVIAYAGTSAHLEGKLREELRRRQAWKPRWFWNLRLVQALVALMRPPSPGLALARLRERDPALRASFVGPDSILSGPDESDRLVARARSDLEGLIRLCRSRKVPLILATVPANLRFAPFATRFADDKARAEGEAAIRRAGELLAAGRAREALALAEAMSAAHPEAAGLHFRLAQAREKLGDLAGAAKSYRAARETDACPARALESFNRMVRRLADGRPGVWLADLEGLFEAAVPDHIPDDRLFLDQCHPKPEAHRLMAEELFRVLGRAGLLRASARAGR